ncbi:MAG: A24 family peptidase C-terminal domain-containing protein [Thermoplasmata archaeon]
MDESEIVNVLRVGLAVAVFSYASVLDWRTRRIGNKYWVLLTGAGVALIPVQIVIDDRPLWYAVTLLPVLAILIDVYSEFKEGTALAKLAPIASYGFAVASVLCLGIVYWNEPGFGSYIAVPAMILLIVVLYMLDVVRGGADAKALIALSVLFPVRPLIGPLPLMYSASAAVDSWLPFSFIVLFNASVFTLLVPLALLLRNALTGNMRLPYALVGYLTDAATLKGKHVWLMEHMTERGHEMHMRPRRSEDLEAEASKLIEAGHARVWVTPKIPFVVFLLASIVFTVVLGNLLVLLLPY